MPLMSSGCFKVVPLEYLWKRSLYLGLQLILNSSAVLNININIILIIICFICFASAAKHTTYLSSFKVAI